MQTYLGRCGGQVVSILAFNSDDPISNPSDAYSFFCKITNENKKVAGVGPFLNANVQTIVYGLQSGTDRGRERERSEKVIINEN